jgi:VanZ family protein
MTSNSSSRTYLRGQPERPTQLSAFLLVAYTSLVIAVSLYPFTGWRVPADPAWAFLWARWPRYLLAWEVPLNVAAYVPLGMLMAWRQRTSASRVGRVALSGVFGFALSFCLEGVQAFMPARIASNLDLASNGMGALAGGIVGVVLAETRQMRARLDAWRASYFASGPYADLAIVLVLVWFFAQLSPELALLGTSDLRTLLGSAAVEEYSAVAYFGIETLQTSMNLICVFALARRVSTSTRTAVAIALLMVVAAPLCKVFGAHTLLLEPRPWLSLTPGAFAGILMGAAFLGIWQRFIRLPLTWLGVVAVIGIQVFSYLLPINPYLALMARPIAIGHPASINGSAWAIAQVWPWIALLCIVRLSPSSEMRRRLDLA